MKDPPAHHSVLRHLEKRNTNRGLHQATGGKYRPGPGVIILANVISAVIGGGGSTIS